MESAKSVDSDVSKESNEEMAEEGSERSSQSRKRTKGKGKRDSLVEKIAEMMIKVAYNSKQYSHRLENY